MAPGAWRKAAAKQRSAGVAFALLAALGCVAHFPGGASSSNSFVPGGMARRPADLAGVHAAPVIATPARAAATTHAQASLICAAGVLGAAGLALLGAPKRRQVAGSGQVVVMPKVTMHARSARPTTPMGTRGKRRNRAGRMRPIFRGRQIAVRVNPKTNKPIRYRMHVMPGDTVQIMKGKDAGKVTTVLRIYPKWNKILCLGVNYCIKHVRPMREDEVGQRVQVEAPMHSSCVMHYSETEGVAGLLGLRFVKKTLSDGREVVKKERYNKATGETILAKAPQKWVAVLDRPAEDED